MVSPIGLGSDTTPSSRVTPTIAAVSSELYAIGDICTHEHVRLSGGWLEGDRIECPLHQSCFEIRTGRVIEGCIATADVPVYGVKVEEGGVFVRRGE